MINVPPRRQCRNGLLHLEDWVKPLSLQDVIHKRDPEYMNISWTVKLIGLEVLEANIIATQEQALRHAVFLGLKAASIAGKTWTSLHWCWTQGEKVLRVIHRQTLLAGNTDRSDAVSDLGPSCPLLNGSPSTHHKAFSAASGMLLMALMHSRTKIKYLHWCHQGNAVCEGTTADAILNNRSM